MASRLVETVMINLDDFADSFLTCGTCFSGYDSQERAAKLLPCSHTICRSCLERILETQAQSSTIRCPICRETILIPSGGAAAFPPAFIVNQLLDLISTQRRDIVPKCRLHSNQELLFCETCDVVFCAECRGRSHSAPSGNDAPQDVCFSSATGIFNGLTFNHNVISFNVAIRRCTEIMLNKMHLCVQELERARNAVSDELGRLMVNKNVCVDAINSKFAEIVALVERRQAELLDTVNRLGEEKHRALTDQLSLIESEREAVCRECDNLKGILDVRSISKAIGYLNEKLDKISSLTEPRENAFLRYQDCSNTPVPHPSMERVKLERSLVENPLEPIHTGHYVIADTFEPASASIVQPPSSVPSSDQPLTSNSNLLDIARCLASFGTISVSTTYPALCTIHLPPQLVPFLTAKSVIQTVDYHGRPQLSGGTDPIDIQFTDADGQLVTTELVDLNDGTYELLLRPTSAGIHQLSVRILSRPIRGSPFQLNVRHAQQRIWCFNETSDGRALIQPFAVAYGPYPNNDPTSIANDPHYIYLLDTGNSRLLVLDPELGTVHATLVGSALSGQAATGIAWSPDGLWVVNWRTKSVLLLDPRTDEVTKSIHSPHFVEPTSACRCPLTGRLYVADNGAGCVFCCDPVTGQTQRFIGACVQSVDESNPVTHFEQILESQNASVTYETTKLSPRSGLHGTESRNFRRITGMCATCNGEVVISFGSSIRVFSSTGMPLATLVPPVISKGVATGTCDRASSILDRNSTVRQSVERTQWDHNSSTISTGNAHSISRVSSTFSLRGLFGGVFVAQPPLSESMDFPDRLGVCLLASYSDRKRSGVVVWPHHSWAGALTNTHAISNNQSRSACSLHSSAAISQTGRFPYDAVISHEVVASAKFCGPYLIEAEPGLRRLAGLVALSDCRHLAVVDQGAQSLCRLRYA